MGSYRFRTWSFTRIPAMTGEVPEWKQASLPLAGRPENSPKGNMGGVFPFSPLFGGGISQVVLTRTWGPSQQFLDQASAGTSRATSGRCSWGFRASPGTLSTMWCQRPKSEISPPHGCALTPVGSIQGDITGTGACIPEGAQGA